MRILVLGCQKIAIKVIEFILATEHELVGVVTHDEQIDTLFSDTPVNEFCFTRGIPTIRFDRKIDYELIKKLKPDIIFSIYYRKLISKNLIELPPMGCINMHPSLLPLNRGPSPTLYGVLRNEKHAGMTLHYIDEGMDTGDIIAQEKIDIGHMTGFELSKAVMDCGFKLFVDNFDSIIAGTNKRVKQDHSKATCNIKFDNRMRDIDWVSTPSQLMSHARAFAKPYAQAITYYGKDRLPVFINVISPHGGIRDSAGPGSFVVRDGALIVQTHTVPVIILRNEWASDMGTMSKILYKGRGRFVL